MPQPGDSVGGFRLEAVIGRGGMGVVYRARQIGLDRVVALKVISPELADDPGFRARFEREARLAAAVEHPNVLPVYEAGERDGVLYIAMRLVDGPDLGVLVRQGGPLEPGRAARLIAQVAGALDAAHARGLIHRDVKPRNVLIAPGEDGADHAYLMDFGIARLAETGATLTGDLGWAGSVDYAAPEQIRGQAVDARTDVYALGGVLFWALTARAPFARETAEAKLWAHLHEPPPRPSEAAPGVPHAFDAIVVRALAKEPADRYAAAHDVGRAVLAAAGSAGEAVASPLAGPASSDETVVSPPARGDASEAPTTTTRRVSRASRRGRAAALATGAAALAAAGAVAVALSGGDEPEVPAAAPTGDAAKPYDFNGDGFQDVAVGAPAARREAGAVVVLPGSPRGMSFTPLVLDEASPGIPGPPEHRDAFGAALTSADFDRDGYADLAVGAPGENADDVARREGVVIVLYGSQEGLVTTRAERFTGPPTEPPDPGGFGTALAASDLDGDGFAELVVGAPGDAAARGSAGSLRLFFGGERGLERDGARTVARPEGIAGAFGARLAVADVNGDRVPDIVEATSGEEPAPRLSYCPGTRSGGLQCTLLQRAGNAPLTALAAGDVTGDGYGDIVAGAGGGDVGGTIMLWRGSAEGPAGKPQSMTQDDPSVYGNDQRGDSFGASVAVADLDGDGSGDIVVGAPGEDSGEGRVTVIAGAPAGGTPAGGRSYSERTRGVRGTRRPGDRFGAALTLLDTNGDKRQDLVVAGERGRTLTMLRGLLGRFTGEGSRAYPVERAGRQMGGPMELVLGRPDGS